MSRRNKVTLSSSSLAIYSLSRALPLLLLLNVTIIFMDRYACTQVIDEESGSPERWRN